MQIIGFICLFLILGYFSVFGFFAMFNNLGQYNIGGAINSFGKKFFTLIFIGVLCFLWFVLFKNGPFTIKFN